MTDKTYSRKTEESEANWLTEYESVAMGATQGKWHLKHQLVDKTRQTICAAEQNGSIAYLYGQVANGTHISTFDPHTILAMCALIREMGEALEIAECNLHSVECRVLKQLCKEALEKFQAGPGGFK